MAQTRRAASAVTTTPVVATPPAPIDALALARATRKTLEEMAPREVALATEIDILRNSMKPLDPDTADWVKLNTRRKAKADELATLKAVRIGARRFDALDKMLDSFFALSGPSYKLTDDQIAKMQSAIFSKIQVGFAKLRKTSETETKVRASAGIFG